MKNHFGLKPFQTKKAFKRDFKKGTASEKSEQLALAISQASDKKGSGLAWFGGELHTAYELQHMLGNS